MTAEMTRTTRSIGLDAEGNRVTMTTFDSRPRPPQSAAEWGELRIAMLGTRAAWSSGRVLAGLLRAGDAAAVRAAVAAGRELGEYERWGVLKTLEEYRQLARSEYAPAAGLMDRLYAAWTAKHGSKEPPRPVRELPAAGTGVSAPRMGIA